ncbi:MAG: peptidoglycan DD-metalloendopeptidase family protein [Anaerolineae bacterium]
MAGQSQCDSVTSIRFPVDTGTFQIMQDFGAPSPRHQGRYHTGEDWYGGRGTSIGQTVYAIANGRVTFSSPGAWGRDGGVIIIEHTFPDGTVAYSMYGHIAEGNGIGFPPVLSCVREGDPLAVIQDIRPAPHVHFEIRTNNPDVPGAGYVWDFPTLGGWRRPSKFILNWQLWLSRAHRWHLDLADEAGPISPPVSFNDNSLIYLDADRVSRVSSDGRVLWRVNLDQPAVGVIPYQDAVAVLYASGSLRQIYADGSLGEQWNLGLTFDGAPVIARDLVLLHTADRQVVALDSNAHTIFWRIADMPPIERAAAGASAIGLITADNHLFTLSYAGEIVDQAVLREPGALIADADDQGGLLAFTRGGFWRISPTGEWALPLTDTPFGGESAAIEREADGRVYGFDGFTLRAYQPDLSVRWTVDLPGVQGQTQLESTGDFVILTSSYGTIAAVRAADGAVCNAGRIFGDRRSQLWSALGSDGLLRVFTADQIIGLDWQRFLLGCAG